MKRNPSMYLRAAVLAGGLAFFSAQATPLLSAQSPDTQTPNETPSPQQDQQKSQTFVGKIVKARNGQFALLTDEQNGKGLYLDDQDKAKGFEGKSVKVTGVLDVATNMVHVTDIQEA